MTDREQIIAAAKACGAHLVLSATEDGVVVQWSPVLRGGVLWNPLTDSADCAAMCARLGINTEWCNESQRVVCSARWHYRSASFSDHNNDPEAAWRYAATMVAAKIGGMK